MSNWFAFHGFTYPFYQQPSDGAGTSGTHHNDDDDDDDNGDNGDDDEYVDELC